MSKLSFFLVCIAFMVVFATAVEVDTSRPRERKQFVGVIMADMINPAMKQSTHSSHPCTLLDQPSSKPRNWLYTCTLFKTKMEKVEFDVNGDKIDLVFGHEKVVAQGKPSWKKVIKLCDQKTGKCGQTWRSHRLLNNFKCFFKMTARPHHNRYPHLICESIKFWQ